MPVPIVIVCRHNDCPAFYRANVLGEFIAKAEGWFRQSNGAAWCPDHIPSWANEEKTS